MTELITNDRSPNNESLFFVSSVECWVSSVLGVDGRVPVT